MYAKYNKEVLWEPSILRFTRGSSSHIAVAMEEPLAAHSLVFYNQTITGSMAPYRMK